MPGLRRAPGTGPPASLSIAATPAGAMYNLKPESVVAPLDREGAASVRASGTDGLAIAVVLGADPSWPKVGNLERAE